MTTCGVNQGIGPLPSDPDNNSVLSAVPKFGGIEVFWTYPTTNPHALAHVNLYRSQSSNPVTMQLHRVVTGSSFFDRSEDDSNNEEFFYWIEFVSINGTVGALIGPVSAIARPTIEDVLQMLQGEILLSNLNVDLQSEIARIEANHLDINQEEYNRIQAINSITIDLQNYGIDLANIDAKVIDTFTTLIDEDESLSQRIEAVVATSNDNSAAIVNETQARTNADSALAKDILTLSVNVSRETRKYFQETEPPAVVVDNEGDLWIDINDGNAVYRWNSSEWIRVTDPSNTVFRQDDEPVANAVDDLWFDENDSDRVYRWAGSDWVELGILSNSQVNAVVQDYNNAQVGFCLIGGSPTGQYDTRATCEANSGTWLELNALAEAVKGVQVSDGNNTATIQQQMVAHRNSLGGLEAQYTVKIDANGKVAGFGLASEPDDDTGASFTTFQVNVDRFAIVNTTNNQPVAPFYVQGGEVFIDAAVIADASISSAMIKDASITNAKISNTIKSNNFIAGTTGWRIQKTGDAEFNNAVFRGTIDGADGNFTGTIYAENIEGDVLDYEAKHSTLTTYSDPSPGATNSSSAWKTISSFDVTADTNTRFISVGVPTISFIPDNHYGGSPGEYSYVDLEVELVVNSTPVSSYRKLVSRNHRNSSSTSVVNEFYTELSVSLLGEIPIGPVTNCYVRARAHWYSRHWSSPQNSVGTGVVFPGGAAKILKESDTILTVLIGRKGNTITNVSN